MQRSSGASVTGVRETNRHRLPSHTPPPIPGDSWPLSPSPSQPISLWAGTWHHAQFWAARGGISLAFRAEHGCGGRDLALGASVGGGQDGGMICVVPVILMGSLQ
jgi:hypothetical protein